MKKTEEGSYAVEAAFIVPIVLGLAFTILYTLFWLHDQVILQAKLKNLIFLEAEEGAAYEKGCQAYLQECLWCLHLQEAEIGKGMTAVSGSAKAQAQWKIPIMSFFMEEKQGAAFSESYGLLHPEESIRYGITSADNPSP